MSKGDFFATEGEEIEDGPPDFCKIGQHSDEIIVTDKTERVCNDCGRREEVGPDECIDGEGVWRPEHKVHFGVCVRCDAEME
jgi:hypothetical protein